LGKLYNQKGDLEQAAVYVEKSFPILIKAYGEKHPNVAISYYNVSVLHKKQGDYVKSLELANKAYEILREILPENHPTLKTISDGIEDVKQKMK
jgi:tetratricopeptide (TPR) repeat protein